jgi:nucleotide-binding universal stress UspA family protein
MFKKILFATNISPACDYAARVAFDLAKRYNAELIVLYAPGVPTRGFSQFVMNTRTGEKVTYGEEYLSHVKKEMKNTYKDLIEKCEKYTLEVFPGIPHTEVLRIARKRDVDLIIMGSSTRENDERSNVYRKIVGSTLQAVAKSARCPVLVIGRPAASFWGGFSNIVFGTDFSKASDSAFLFAYKIAKALECTLHIFHALDIGSIYSGKVIEQLEIEDSIRETREKMKKMYVTKMEGFDDYELEVWEGIPYVEIVKYARENYADLIVMAHHTREPDPEKALLGSTMEQVVLRATCPVASVNRPGKVENSKPSKC